MHAVCVHRESGGECLVTCRANCFGGTYCTFILPTDQILFSGTLLFILSITGRFIYMSQHVRRKQYSLKHTKPAVSPTRIRRTACTHRHKWSHRALWMPGAHMHWMCAPGIHTVDVIQSCGGGHSSKRDWLRPVFSHKVGREQSVLQNGLPLKRRS